MFANRDRGAEQPGVHRADPHMHIVDIAAVDPDQNGAAFGEPVRGIRGEIRMVAEIGVSAPMPVPPKVKGMGTFPVRAYAVLG